MYILSICVHTNTSKYYYCMMLSTTKIRFQQWPFSILICELKSITTLRIYRYQATQNTNKCLTNKSITIAAPLFAIPHKLHKILDELGIIIDRNAPRTVWPLNSLASWHLICKDLLHIHIEIWFGGRTLFVRNAPLEAKFMLLFLHI